MRGHWRHVRVEYGTLDDGRWYAARSNRRGVRAWVASDERRACDRVDAWLGAGWRETTGQDA